MELLEGAVLGILLDFSTNSNCFLIFLQSFYYCFKKQFPDSTVEFSFGCHYIIFLLLGWDTRIPAFLVYFLVASASSHLGSTESALTASTAASIILNYNKILPILKFPLIALNIFSILSTLSFLKHFKFKYNQLLGLLSITISAFYEPKILIYVLENLDYVLYWAIISLISILSVIFANHYSVSFMIQRKMFHFMLIFIFIPGLANKTLLSFAFLSALYLLLIIEALRSQIPLLHNFFIKFIDERDSPELIITHIYLLAGFGFPVLFSLILHHDLLAWAGIISLGIGDTFACLIGFYFGKLKLPHRNKTVEGTLAGFLSMCLTLQSFHILTPSITSVLLLTSFYEAYTKKIDNLVLPIFTFSLFALLV